MKETLASRRALMELKRARSRVFAMYVAGFIVAAVAVESFRVFLMPFFGVVAMVATLVFVGSCALPALGALLQHRERWRVWTYVVACAFVAALVLLPWHPRKRFLMDLSSIETGMTVAEVEARMAQYEPRGDSTWAGPCPYGANLGGPGDRMMGFAWNSTDGRYNADVGDITFLAGRVVNVEFSPD